MADSKRSNNNVRVATPRTGGSSPAPKDILDSLSRAIGARVKLTMASPLSHTLEGSLFAVDTILNIVAINTRAASTTAADGVSQIGDYHLLSAASIQSFQITSPATSDSSAQVITPANAKRVKERVDARVTTLKEQEATRGKGVTREAQAIFDALKRVNIPIRWHDKQMIAHEAVIIAPPYRPEDCKGSKDKQQVLNQVKKVLEGERRKLREREDRESKSDVNQRKGG